jgi:GT2 family glycosyltransferase
VNSLPPVSLIILNWNGRDLLEECLPSVLAAKAVYAGSVEVLVVDNGSSDDSLSLLETRFPEVRVHSLPSNIGFGEGCNAGVEVAEHERIVLLNNDLQVDERFLEPLIPHLENHDVFAVGPKTFFWDRQRVYCSAIRGEFRFGKFFQLWAVRNNNDICDRTAPTLYVSGATLAFHRDKFRQLGGFDSLFSPLYWEETDLCYRAWQRGWTCLYEPRSVVYHKVSATVLSALNRAQRQYYLKRNYFFFLWKNLHDRDLRLKHFAWLPFWLLWALLRFDRIELVAFRDALSRWSAVQERRRSLASSVTFSDRDVLSGSRWDVPAAMASSAHANRSD